MRLPKINLLVKILIAIALGILAGYTLPIWLDRLFATFNGIFNQFLGFLIPLLIVGFVAPAIAEIGNKAGKMLIATAALAYLSTSLAGFMSFGLSDFIFPHLITPHSLGDLGTGHDLEPYFVVIIPPLMDVMSALTLAFLMGIALAYLPGNTLKSGFVEFREIISLAISKVIIPLLPLYIFGIFLNMTVSGQVATVLSAFMKIILIIFAMSFLLLIIQFSIAGLVAKRNPFKLLWTMLPAYFTALGTQSSAATIPVTLRQAIKMGVSEETAGFVIPLCATIHMSGSAMKIVACAVALMLMEGMPYDAGMFATFICMIGISIVAAPGVPGGAIMASLGLLASFLHFSEANQALMIALYIA
ncbi:MAG: dicarboxylate/amino acid:cation symporter, partial [Muribaculaceae bacterium]|nr:dicarboxylate/amino acid:cation symporter [Muribaculaceae bacterium]